MKILIGMDESACSSAALEFVSDMPLPADTRVVILSAMQLALPVPAELYAPGAGTDDALMEEQARSHQSLVSKAEQRLRERGLKTEGVVVQGDPRDVLVQAARDQGADLVVVGSHGRNGIARLVMGSVATHVVNHAPCSVLVVKTKGRHV